jgi:hypothetical protein
MLIMDEIVTSDKPSGQILASAETGLIGRILEVWQRSHKEIKPTDHSESRISFCVSKL